MATAQGIVRFHQQGQTVMFRVEGRGTMSQSLPMRRCGERSHDAGANRVCVDLRDCTYMDSTFLGTLLTLRKTFARTHGNLILIAPSVACVRILQQMGLDDVLTTEPADLDATAEWTVLANEGEDPTSFRRNVVQAHEELANLPGQAGEQFKAVIRCMAQAGEAEKPATKPPSPPHE